MSGFIDWLDSLSLLQSYGISVLCAFICAMVSLGTAARDWLGEVVEESGASPALVTLVLMAAAAVMSLLWPMTLVYTVVMFIRKAVSK